MMTCEEFRRTYQLLLDRGSQADLPEDLARHIALCQPCTGFARAMSAVDKALRNLPESELPAGLPDKLSALPLQEMRRAFGLKNFVLKGAAYITGGVAILGLGTLLPQEDQFWSTLVLLVAGYTMFIASVLKYKRLSVDYE